MQTNNQFSQGNIMPLLMYFTTPTPIQEADNQAPSLRYDEQKQISYDMRTVCTRCAKLKLHTGPGGRTVNADYKNENDDTKSVR